MEQAKPKETWCCVRMGQPSAPPLPKGDTQTALTWCHWWHFTVTALEMIRDAL